MVCDQVVAGFPILVEEAVLPKNLVLMNMVEFDIILGMDWLAKYHASMDCFNKEVIFQIPYRRSSSIGAHGKDRTSCDINITNPKVPAEGARRFLVLLLEAKKEGKELDAIPKVREFWNVFPLEREIQFEIEVV